MRLIRNWAFADRSTENRFVNRMWMFPMISYAATIRRHTISTREQFRPLGPAAIHAGKLSLAAPVRVVAGLKPILLINFIICKIFNMKIKRKKNKKMYSRIVFWLGVLVLGMALGAIVQFTRAWVEPPAGVVPPGGDIAAPINTGATTQTKNGGDVCVNIGGSVKCISTGGGGGGINTKCICKFDVSGGTGNCNLTAYKNCGAGWQTYMQYRQRGSDCGCGTDVCNLTLNGIMYFPCTSDENSLLTGDLANGWHSSSDCTSAGGTVVQDGSTKFCRLSPTGSGSCPSGWNSYSSWTSTGVKTCNGTNDSSCTQATSCTTSTHAWGNTAPETCSYNNGIYHNDPVWNPSQYCSVSVGEGGSWTFCNPDQWGDYCTVGWDGTYCYRSDGSWIGFGSCGTDSYNYYGCGTTTYNNYCAASSRTCTANITQVGCY